jgi:D-isomer specific 2-hydroxyacid dehydrogenase, catalytic domain
LKRLGEAKILVAELLDDDAIAMLSAACQVDAKYRPSRDELLAVIPECRGIIVRSEIQINKQSLDAAFNLRIVGRAGSGLDNIDVPYDSRVRPLEQNGPSWLEWPHGPSASRRGSACAEERGRKEVTPGIRQRFSACWTVGRQD